MTLAYAAANELTDSLLKKLARLLVPSHGALLSSLLLLVPLPSHSVLLFKLPWLLSQLFTT
jgi:hypothetical protein